MSARLDDKLDANKKLGGRTALEVSESPRCVEVAIDDDEVWIRFRLLMEAGPLPGQSASLVELRTERDPEQVGIRMNVREPAGGDLNPNLLELVAFGSNAVGRLPLPHSVRSAALLHVRVGTDGDGGGVEAFLAANGAWTILEKREPLTVAPLGKLRLGMTNEARGLYYLDDIMIARSMPPVP